MPDAATAPPAAEIRSGRGDTPALLLGWLLYVAGSAIFFMMPAI